MECNSLQTALTYLVYGGIGLIGIYGTVMVGGLLLGFFVTRKLQ